MIFVDDVKYKNGVGEKTPNFLDGASYVKNDYVRSLA
jgi:hypothetical protein